MNNHPIPPFPALSTGKTTFPLQGCGDETRRNQSPTSKVRSP